MNIDQGLFKLEMIDHHAVLGLPLTAEPKQVRKRYLEITRKLHPDSWSGASESQKQQASELLSKLVNPAYETLGRGKPLAEHSILLRLKGQQLSRQPATLLLTSSAAKALAADSSNLEYNYRTIVQKLSQRQYEVLEQVLELIGEISQLNAAYLAYKDNFETPVAAPVAPEAEAEQTDQPPPRRHYETIIDSYINRAKEFEYQCDYVRGILELREAIAAHPQSASCHSYLAKLYLKAGQETMAKIHAKRALEFDPNDSMAIELQKRFQAIEKRAARVSSDQPKKGSGLLSRLFGSRKR